MDETLRADGSAVVVTVRVQPGAARTGLVGRHGDALKVRVTAPADRGRANAMVEALLAEVFGVPRRAVAVTTGASSRTKRVRVDGLDLAGASSRLRAALGEPRC